MTIQTVHQSFEEAAKRAKLSTALICGGRSTSYGELSQISNCFASILERHGAGPGALVGLSGERSIDLVVGLLAILKTGAAYVPLDLGYPPDWISHMIKHAGVRLLVNTHRNSPATQFERIEHIGLAIEALDLTKSPDAIHSCVTTEDPAAVIYTSGTAGIPKGVVIPHRAIVTRKDEFREYLAESSTSLWRSSICVVGHISNLLLPLMAGKKIVIAGRVKSRV